MTDTLLTSPLARAIGLALLQFLWQGALIGAATAALLILLRRSTAEARYAVACAGFALMIVAPVVTAAGDLRESRMAAARDAAARLLPQSSTDSAIVPAATNPESAPDRWASDGFRARIERWLPLVVMAWIAGVVVFALHLFREWIRLRRLCRGALPLDAGPRPEALQRIAARLGVRRFVRLAESALIEVPAVIGWLRPVILVPASALAGLSPAILDAILAHELAHVRRGDYLVNVVQCAIEVLLFYHPAVWWVSGQIRRERENCCDDVAASLSPDRVTYARALASLEELRGARRLAMAADGADLLSRIRRLVEPESVSGPRWSGGLMTCAMLTVLLFAVGAQIRSMPASPTPTPVASAAAAPVPVRPVAEPVAQPASHVVSEPVPQPVQSRMSPRAIPRVAPVRTDAPAQAETTAPSPEPVAQAVGQMSGQVSDPSGGVVPGVTITVTSVRTSAARTAVTNARGQFRFDSLADGDYDLTATLPGFRTFKTTVHVAPNDNVSAGIRLQLGTLTETIQIVVPRPSSRSSTSAPARDPIVTSSRPPASRAPRPDDQLTAVSTAEPSGVLRVGGDINEPKKITSVDPVYPEIAKTALVSGYVIIEAIISKTGAVTSATVVKSHPLFDEAALAAVRQWVYTPAKLNGVPVEVAMNVTLIFSMK